MQLIFRVIRIFLHVIAWLIIYVFCKIIRKDTSFIFPKMLQQLGPFYIKFGQVMSTRVDLLSVKSINLLEQLKDNAKPVRESTMFKVFKRNFGSHINANFTNVTLVSAASIAQVYYGYLNNKKVAIKIIKPGVRRLLELDLKILYGIFAILEQFIASWRRVELTGLFKNLRQEVVFETDLRFEAANIEQAGDALNNVQYIFKRSVNVCNVYWQYVTPDVLVSDFVDGYSICDIEALKSHNIKLEDLSYDLLKLFFYQVLHLGSFHGDIHSGNILVTPQGAIYLIDFGIVGRVDDRVKYYLLKLFNAFLKQDYMAAAEVHFDLGWINDKKYRVEDFALACQIIMQNLLHKPQNKINIGKFLQDLMSIATIFEMKTQESVLTLQKNLVYLENIVKSLTPDLNTANFSLIVLEDLQKEIRLSKSTIFLKASINNMRKAFNKSLLQKGYQSIDTLLANSNKKVYLHSKTFNYIKVVILLIIVLLFTLILKK